MKKIKWYGYTFILFVLFMYIMGIYDFFMMLSHNSEYYLSHNYGKEVIEYFTNYPIYFMIFWIVNLLTGFISPLLLTLKKKLSGIPAVFFMIESIVASNIKMTGNIAVNKLMPKAGVSSNFKTFCSPNDEILQSFVKAFGTIFLAPKLFLQTFLARKNLG